jgi:uncharacterized protein (TIGR04255 family)
MSDIKFSNPPLTEVVLGVIFNAPEFSSVHFGLYWEKIRERFPTLPTDRPSSGGEGLGLSFSFLPPLRRVWFESEDKRTLVQLQSDRFYYNWRKQDNSDHYPKFEQLYPKFIQEWNDFNEWWRKDVGEPPFLLQYELTYSNQIDQEFGWKNPAEHQNLFTFTGRDWRGFLPPPESHIFSLQFALPDNAGSLIVNGNQAISSLNDEPVMILELTARSSDASGFELESWFTLAHDYLVSSFIDLTQIPIQKKWGLYE